MANSNTPRGFTPVGNMHGGATGHCNTYYKSTTAGVIGVGDVVIRVVNSSDPLGGAEIVKATQDAAMTGVVVGISVNRGDLRKSGYLAAADTGYVLVEDNPQALFEVQESGSGTAFAVTDIGKHVSTITAANANTTLGRSVDALDNAAKATGNTFILRRLSNRPNNSVGAYAKWIVQPNLHTEQNASATNITEI